MTTMTRIDMRTTAPAERDVPGAHTVPRAAMRACAAATPTAVRA